MHVWMSAGSKWGKMPLMDRVVLFYCISVPHDNVWTLQLTLGFAASAHIRLKTTRATLPDILSCRLIMEAGSTSNGDGAPRVIGDHHISISNSNHEIPDAGRLSIDGDSHEVLKPTCNVITPVGMLGFGLHADQTDAALAAKIPNGAPTAIILDAGSTDGGPEKLALGKMTIPRETYVRDLKKLIPLVWKYKVPLIFSSAGGDGSDEHVEEMLNIVREVCDAEEYE